MPWGSMGSIWAEFGLDYTKFQQGVQQVTKELVTPVSYTHLTEKMVKFNQTFGMTELERAFGEAYNALLNHMHLGPFMIPTYAAANKTAAVYVDADVYKRQM